jgi:aspartate kinase
VKVIVQKFGGVSVATQESRQVVAARVADAMDRGFAPVVVVSAMGRGGDPYATDTLISMAKKEHPASDTRELDLISSCGEVISTVMVCNSLRARGMDATAIVGGQIGIRTDGVFNNASIIDVNPRTILARLEEGKVAVVAGFQGVTEAGEVTTLGRGGSDTSAVALGVALKAEVVEIYKDVDGIKTADPRLVPTARTISQMTYDETFQLAHEGAKVIHDRAVEIARRYDMPIRVRSVEGSEGTLVARDKACWSQANTTNPVTGVTHLRGLCQVAIPRSRAAVNHTTIFKNLAQAGVSIDMISVTKDGCSFVVEDDVIDQTTTVIERSGVTAQVTRDCAKVSIVGWAIQDLPGIMAGVSEALEEAGVDLLQTSDSLVTISCLIKAQDLPVAAQALHSRFGLDS